MSSRFPRAVGKQPTTLSGSFLDWFSDYQKPVPLARTPATDYFWNAGVNMAYGRDAIVPVRTVRGGTRSGGDTTLKAKGARKRNWSLWGEPAVDIGVEAYNRAATQLAYGNTGAARAELGDLFNDVMGAIVPGWDARPDALKKIVMKPDPAKILERVQQVAPNAGEQVVRAANANGLGVFVNTPGGQVEVTPYNAQSLYGIYPFLTRAQSTLSEMSPMVWLAIGGVGLGLFLMMKR